MDIYVDTSALIKRYIDEEHSDAVTALLQNDEHLIFISELTELEMRRNLARYARSDSHPGMSLLDNTIDRRSQDFLKDKEEFFVFINITRSIWETAFNVVEITGVGSLDALHIATAKSVSKNLRFCTFDKRQAEAAEYMGLVLVKFN